MHLKRIDHLELRVHDLTESAAFYATLFGMSPQDANPPSERVRVCVPADQNDSGFRLVLTEGLPAGSPLTGLDHVSFAADSASAVDALYERARQMALRTTHPRRLNGHYQFYVFDPDGYKLEIIASDVEQALYECGV